ncbi:MAG: protein translocase subunit SecD [Spirochaetaceae bacterium]|nr:protein translocase subunit SecD [Spirochaetaceae bacterium]
MTKRLRLILILAFVAVAVWFLTPTVRWYLILTGDQRREANASREQIRVLARQRADEDLNRLIELARNDPGDPVPDDLGYLVPAARERLRVERRDVPRTWDVATVVNVFPSEGETFVAMEDHHRSELLALKDLRSRSIQLGLDLSGGMYVVIEPDLESLSAQTGATLSAVEEDRALRRALEVLNNRIDQFGVTEPQIRQRGDNQIVVEMPGAPDPERMRSFILGKGRLNFHIVDTEGLARFRRYQAENPGSFLGPDGQPRDDTILTAGTVLRGRYEKDAYGVDQLLGYTVINDEIGLEGSYIQQAQVSRDPITQQPTVIFNLTGEGGDIFFKLTSENVGNVMAVVLDDRVKAAATISEPIRNQVQVTGFTQSEAEDLALVLETGALPVPLDILSQQAIGASLGEDAIRTGLNSIALGMAAVLIFMLVYYKGAGLVADLALVLNLFFLVSVLSVFNFTLTLPSIAGVILTVGMAVDANVIIFERIKEEYRLGKSASAAVTAGFGKAFWTVMDANITTFIAAIALSQLGSGPIQGFAVTLSVGVVSSMFTALVVSRLIFDFFTETLHVERLSIDWRRRAGLGPAGEAA